MKTFLKLFTVLFLLSAVSMGCNRAEAKITTDLSREKAAEAIKVQLPIRSTRKIPLGENETSTLSPDILTALQKEGLIKYQVVGKWGFGNLMDIIVIQMTGKGMKYALALMDRHAVVELSQIEFLKVTGIQFKESSRGKTAVVHYQWRYSEMTPFGDILIDKHISVNSDSATFVLFDDGWRLAQN